jgi:hypothetical protein
VLLFGRVSLFLELLRLEFSLFWRRRGAEHLLALRSKGFGVETRLLAWRRWWLVGTNRDLDLLTVSYFVEQRRVSS